MKRALCRFLAALMVMSVVFSVAPGLRVAQAVTAQNVWLCYDSGITCHNSPSRSDLLIEDNVNLSSFNNSNNRFSSYRFTNGGSQAGRFNLYPSINYQGTVYGFWQGAGGTIYYDLLGTSMNDNSESDGCC